MKPSIVLQTDFGLTTGFVCAMVGVIKTVDQELAVYDLNHEIRPFDMRQASFLLADTIPYWRPGTIFVSVVDPGVGTPRRGCVARLKNGSYVVTPDNGTLTAVLGEIAEVREIDETVNRLKGTEKTSIFHGRDLFAYCAARLAAGVIDFAGVGPEYPVAEIVTLTIPPVSIAARAARGCVTELMEPFGNLETNIRIEDFEKTGITQGEYVRVAVRHKETTVFDKTILYHRSFGYAPPDGEILYNSSSGFMGVAMNRRDFARTYGVEGGSEWRILIAKED